MTRAYQRSKELLHESQQLIPGGVNSPVRAFRAVGGEPLFIERGEGPYLVDVDGNRYIDYMLSWGPLILGHAYPSCRGCPAGGRRRRAPAMARPPPLEAELAQRGDRADAGHRDDPLRQLRHRGGDERPAPGSRLHRPQQDRQVRGLLPRPRRLPAGAGRLRRGHAGPARLSGRAEGRRGRHLGPAVQRPGRWCATLFKHGRRRRLRRSWSSRWWATWASCLRCRASWRTCAGSRSEHGALLIFDEVMTGFRVALGGAQALYGIDPDLTTLGKVIGGGLPVGAYAGKRAIMELVAPKGPMYQAGTLSGNPLAMTAGLVTLAEISQTGRLRRHRVPHAARCVTAGGAAGDAGIPVFQTCVGTMFCNFFTREPGDRLGRRAKKSDTALFARYFRGMLERGRVHGAVAVRGRLHERRARRRHRRSNDRGCPQGPENHLVSRHGETITAGDHQVSRPFCSARLALGFMERVEAQIVPFAFPAARAPRPSGQENTIRGAVMQSSAGGSRRS